MILEVPTILVTSVVKIGSLFEWTFSAPVTMPLGTDPGLHTTGNTAPFTGTVSATPAPNKVRMSYTITPSIGDAWSITAAVPTDPHVIWPQSGLIT